MDNLINNVATSIEKAERRQRAKERRDFVKGIRNVLMSGSAVFKHIRKDILGLSNRVKNIENPTEVLSKLNEVSSLRFKGKEVYIDRLPTLLSNFNAVQCFMTNSQRLKFLNDGDYFSPSAMVDVIIKGATMNQRNYEACLKQKNNLPSLASLIAAKALRAKQAKTKKASTSTKRTKKASTSTKRTKKASAK